MCIYLYTRRLSEACSPVVSYTRLPYLRNEISERRASSHPVLYVEEERRIVIRIVLIGSTLMAINVVVGVSYECPVHVGDKEGYIV